ncbi:MAG: hypothetical protein Crog3KO_31720 [Crocinitomicaceae bacterium]
MKIHVIICVYILCGFQFSAQSQSVVYVNVAALGNNDGSAWIHGYMNLQTAIDNAQPFDTIKVAEGLYVDNFIIPDGKDLVIMGGYDPWSGTRDLVNSICYIDGNGTGSAIFTSNLSNSIIDGFTIQNGSNGGGGIRNEGSTIHLENLTITNNSGGSGAGILNTDSSHVSMVNVVVSNNSANNFGGGVYNRDASELTMYNVTIDNNSGNFGVGIANVEDAILTATSCTFTNNTGGSFAGAIYTDEATSYIDSCSFSQNGGTNGGGMCNIGAIYVQITNSEFSLNTASGSGGALYDDNSTLTILENTIFESNNASNGGAISASSGVSLSVRNCVLLENTASSNGGGIILNGASSLDFQLQNSTIYGNSASSGGGMYAQLDGSDTITNTIFYQNTATTNADLDFTNYSGSTYINYSLTQTDTVGWGGTYTWGTGNLTPGTNPLFENENDAIGSDATWATTDDGLLLSLGSPCANSGSALFASSVDIIGTSRPANPSMGAFEGSCSYFDAVAPQPATQNLPDIISPCAVDFIPEPMVMDECSVLITNDAVFPIASNATVTWTYTDLIGNVSTQQQNIVISGAINTQVSQLDEITLEAQNTAATSYQWVDCSTQNAISGATSAQFTATSNGQYAVVVTEVNCSDTSACFTIDQVGLDAMSNEHLLLAPNPSNGGTVKILGEGELSNLLVMDATGKRIPVEIDWNQRSFNTEHLSAGTYFVQLDSAQSSATQILIITSN